MLAAAQLNMRILGTNRADDIEKHRLVKVQEMSKSDYQLGIEEGQNKYKDGYSMDAAVGCNL